MGEEFGRFAFFDDFTLVDEDDAGGDFFGEIHFVSNNHNGHAVIGELTNQR